MNTRHARKTVFAACVLSLAFVLAMCAGCSQEPEWMAVNEQLVQEHGIQERIRDDIPQDIPIESNLGEGVVKNIDTLQEVELAEGVTARMYWDKGNLVAWVDMEPGAAIPEETLPGERIMVMWEGSVEQLINGQYVEMIARERDVVTGIAGGTPRKDFVYLEEGAQNAVRAGDNGARFVEVYWPARLDYMALTGHEYDNIPTGSFPVPPSHEPNTVYDLYNVQWTELVPGANSRIISGEGAQLSFIRMDPGSDFAYHNHPEAQVMISLRGWIDERILDGITRMEEGACLCLPAYMVHGGINGPYGCDALDVFYPPRDDYDQSRRDALDKFHSIIPEDAEVELVADGAVEGPGLNFTEGPTWVDGKLYFSSMYFAEDWSGDPSRSATVVMEPDGDYEYIATGMQTNGTALMANGNLAVCDMFGHRIIEMTTSGRVVRTLASEYNGRRLDGPNDLVIDDKGGIYFTDPQFIPGMEKMQPGRSVYYRRPNGEIIRVIEPDVIAMPNGVLLSPDGNTFYVNNTYEDGEGFVSSADVGQYVMAFDVNDDGTLSNMRRFGEMKLTAQVLDAQQRSTSADGMAIDEEGNVYCTSYMGIQIFNPAGEYMGLINFPVMPVSCAFGGEDFSTLYATCYDKVYKIETNVRGLK